MSNLTRFYEGLQHFADNINNVLSFLDRISSTCNVVLKHAYENKMKRRFLFDSLADIRSITDNFRTYSGEHHDLLRLLLDEAKTNFSRMNSKTKKLSQVVVSRVDTKWNCWHTLSIAQWSDKLGIQPTKPSELNEKGLISPTKPFNVSIDCSSGIDFMEPLPKSTQIMKPLHHRKDKRNQPSDIYKKFDIAKQKTQRQKGINLLPNI